MDVDEVAKLFT